MPEQLLTILKFCLLALVYLFFLRVLRAVWAEVRAPEAAPAPAGGAPAAAARPARRPAEQRRRSRPPSELVVTEPDSLAGSRYPLGADVVVGRGGGSTVVIDDTYVSQRHTRFFVTDNVHYVEDLGSTNGTYLNRSRVTSPTIIHRGDQVQVGNVVLEVR